MYDPWSEDDDYEIRGAAARGMMSMGGARRKTCVPVRREGERGDSDWLTEGSESDGDSEEDGVESRQQRHRVRFWKTLGGSTGLLVPPNSLKDVGGYESESDAEPERRKRFWTDPTDKEISFRSLVLVIFTQSEGQI